MYLTNTKPTYLNWDREQVTEWLTKNKLEAIAEIFSVNNVTGNDLATMGDEEFLEFGLTKFQLKNFKGLISELNSGNSPNQPQSSGLVVPPGQLKNEITEKGHDNQLPIATPELKKEGLPKPDNNLSEKEESKANTQPGEELQKALISKTESSDLSDKKESNKIDEYYGLSPCYKIDTSTYFDYFISLSPNPEEDIIEEIKKGDKEKFWINIALYFINRLKIGFPFSDSIILLSYLAKKKISEDIVLLREDEKIIFLSLLNSISSEARVYLLRSYAKSHPIPLCYPLWDKDINHPIAIKEGIELMWLIKDSLNITSIGFGKAGKIPYGKSKLLDKIFGTSFYSYDKQQVYKGGVDIQFDIFHEATEVPINLIDIEGNASESLVQKVLEITNLLLIHLPEEEKSSFKSPVGDCILLLRDSSKSAVIDINLSEYKLSSNVNAAISVPNFEKKVPKTEIKRLKYLVVSKSIKFLLKPEILKSKEWDHIKFSKMKYIEKLISPEESKDYREIHNILISIKAEVYKYKENYFCDGFLSVVKQEIELRKINKLLKKELDKAVPSQDKIENLKNEKKKIINKLKDTKITTESKIIILFKKLLKMNANAPLMIAAISNDIGQIVRAETFYWKEKIKFLYELYNEASNYNEITWEKQHKNLCSDHNKKQEERSKIFVLLQKVYPEKIKFPQKISNNYSIMIKEIYSDIEQSNMEIVKRSLSIELLWRELIYFFKYQNINNTNQEFLYEIFRALIWKGYPFEIIDGDNLSMETSFIEKTLEKSKERVLVISVIGPQGSGKSTLLNYLFGSEFLTSSDRCTKGVYGTLIKISDKCKKLKENYDVILLLDTEGLLSVYKSEDNQFDRKIILFCLSISQIVLLNIKGEMPTPMMKLLTICVNSLIELKIHKVQSPKLHIIKNQVADLNQDNLMSDFNKVFEEITNIIKIRECEPKSILSISYDNVHILPAAFEYIFHELPNLKYQTIKIKEEYAKESQKLAQSIFESAINYKSDNKMLPYDSLKGCFITANSIWETITDFKSLILFKTIKEYRDNIAIGEILRGFERDIEIFRNEINKKIKDIGSTETSNLDTEEKAIIERVYQNNQKMIKKCREMTENDYFEYDVIMHRKENLSFALSKLNSDLAFNIKYMKFKKRLRNIMFSGNEMVKAKAIELYQGDKKLDEKLKKKEFDILWDKQVNDATKVFTDSYSMLEEYLEIKRKLEFFGLFKLMDCDCVKEEILANYKFGNADNSNIDNLINLITKKQNNIGFLMQYDGKKKIINHERKKFPQFCRANSLYKSKISFWSIKKKNFLYYLVNIDKFCEEARNISGYDKLSEDEKINQVATLIESKLTDLNIAFSHDLMIKEFKRASDTNIFQYIYAEKFSDDTIGYKNEKILAWDQLAKSQWLIFNEDIMKKNGILLKDFAENYTSAINDIIMKYQNEFSQPIHASELLIIQKHTYLNDDLEEKKIKTEAYENGLDIASCIFTKHSEMQRNCLNFDLIYETIQNNLEQIIIDNKTINPLEGKVLQSVENILKEIFYEIDWQLMDANLMLNINGLAHFGHIAVFTLWKIYFKEKLEILKHGLKKLDETRTSQENYFLALLSHDEDSIDKSCAKKVFDMIASEIDWTITKNIKEILMAECDYPEFKRKLSRQNLQKMLDEEIFLSSDDTRIKEYLEQKGFEKEIKKKYCAERDILLYEVEHKMKNIYKDQIIFYKLLYESVNKIKFSLCETYQILKSNEILVIKDQCNEISLKKSHKDVPIERNIHPDEQIYIVAHKDNFARAGLRAMREWILGNSIEVINYVEGGKDYKFTTPQLEYITKDNMKNNPYIKFIREDYFKQDYIYNFAAWITEFEKVINERMNLIFTKLEKFSIDEYDEKKLLTGYLQKIAIGCLEKCPTCGRICDVSDEEHIINGKGSKHACYLGHFVRASIGITLENKISSVKTCEELDEEEFVIFENKQMKWKDIKTFHEKWDFANIACKTKKDTCIIENRRKIAYFIWDKFRKIFEKKFSYMKCVDAFHYNLYVTEKKENTCFIFALDASGSMGGDRWNKLLDIAFFSLNKFRSDSTNCAYILSFSSNDQEVSSSKAENIDKYLSNWSVNKNNIKFFGNKTCFASPCKEIIKIVKEQASKNIIILFISDGEGLFPEVEINILKKLRTIENNIILCTLGIECSKESEIILRKMSDELNGKHFNTKPDEIFCKFFEVLK